MTGENRRISLIYFTFLAFDGMDLRLTTTREISEKREKIAYWNKIAQWLRITQDCNADYYVYKEIELRIKKWKERLKSLRRKV